MESASAAGMPHVLVVEPNSDLAPLLEINPRRRDCAVDRVASTKRALAVVTSLRYDAVVVDWDHVARSPASLIPEFRARGPSRIIAIGLPTVLGKFQVPAWVDDCLPKPFAFNDLLACLRHPGASACLPSRRARAGNLSMDLVTQEVGVAGAPLVLPPRERGLLRILMQSPGRTVLRRVIMETLFGEGRIADDNAVNVNIYRLRVALRRAGATAEIENEAGLGYRIGERIAGGGSSFGEVADAATINSGSQYGAVGDGLRLREWLTPGQG